MIVHDLPGYGRAVSRVYAAEDELCEAIIRLERLHQHSSDEKARKMYEQAVDLIAEIQIQLMRYHFKMAGLK